MLIGHQVEFSPYQVIYRVEGGVLIFCALHRAHDTRSQPQQLFQFMSVLRRIFRALHQLVSIRMLVIADVFDPVLVRKRQQLVNVLLSLGAARIRYHGDLWLELPASGLLNRLMPVPFALMCNCFLNMSFTADNYAQLRLSHPVDLVWR